MLTSTPTSGHPTPSQSGEPPAVTVGGPLLSLYPYVWATLQCHCRWASCCHYDPYGVTVGEPPAVTVSPPSRHR